MVIRPVGEGDLGGLMLLARSAGVGLTSLPVNEGQLSKKINRSVRSFAGVLDPAEQAYVFVLEDSATGAVAGICAIEAAVGLKEPWYNYRVGTVVHASEALGVYSRHATLFLSNDHTGHSELCTLFLHPDYRVNRNGGLLSKSRFLFMAQFPELFSRVLVAEMRGVSDEQGRSPFWEALGRHFFSMDFAQADYLTGVGQKAFVAELMPKHPVYVDFLSPEAQQVIGCAHDKTMPALTMLKSEGFHYEGYVDIFDAGPTVQCKVADIRAIKDSVVLPVNIAEPVNEGRGSFYLVANTQREGYRAIVIQVEREASHVTLSPQQAALLKVGAGEMVRSVALSPKE